MIENQKIKFIQFEYGPSNINSKIFLKDFFIFFKNKNYKIFRLYPNWIKPIDKYSIKLENFIPVNYAVILDQSISKLGDYIRNYPRD